MELGCHVRPRRHTKRARGQPPHLATRTNGSRAMATHGSVSAFDRLNFYFAANDVTTEAKKRAILLSACGAPTYKLIRSLVSEPDKLNSLTPYKDLSRTTTTLNRPASFNGTSSTHAHELQESPSQRTSPPYVK